MPFDSSILISLDDLWSFILWALVLLVRAKWLSFAVSRASALLYSEVVKRLMTTCTPYWYQSRIFRADISGSCFEDKYAESVVASIERVSFWVFLVLLLVSSYMTPPPVAAGGGKPSPAQAPGPSTVSSTPIGLRRSQRVKDREPVVAVPAAGSCAAGRVAPRSRRRGQAPAQSLRRSTRVQRQATSSEAPKSSSVSTRKQSSSTRGRAGAAGAEQKPTARRSQRGS